MSLHQLRTYVQACCISLAVLCMPLQADANTSPSSLLDASGTRVTIPAKPQRVIALSEPDLDALLALKIQPVGATRGRGQTDFPTYLQPYLPLKPQPSISQVGNFASPVLDAVLALRPDLILAGGMADPELVAQLRKIAPVVVSFQPGTPWQDSLRLVAQAVGRTAQAQALLDNYQEQAKRLRLALQNKAGSSANGSSNGLTNSISIVRWNPQGPAYMLKQSFASLVAADVALARPTAQQQPGSAHSPPLSLEALDKIDADWLFVGTLNRSEAANNPANAALNTARRNPAFAQLNAVKKGQMVAVDGSLWTGPGGPLAALAVLQDIEKAMLSK